MISNLFKKTKDFWLKYEIKIILLLGFILIAIISFESGYLKGKALKNDLLVVEKVVTEAQNCESGTVSTNTSQIPPINQSSKKECVFVASKNSNKYHATNCTWAKRIKPENRICFSSKEEAAQSGRQPDATCIK